MKRLRRDPLRFDAFRLLTEHIVKRNLTVRDPGALDSLMEEMRRATTESAKSDTFLYGQRAEALF